MGNAREVGKESRATVIPRLTSLFSLILAHLPSARNNPASAAEEWQLLPKEFLVDCLTLALSP